jgi:hypothetical protein
MTLLYVDGFEMGDVALRYSNIGVAGVSTSTITRFGVGRSITSSVAGNMMTKVLAAPVTRCIVGMAITTSEGNVNDLILFSGDAGVTSHVQVRVLTSGAISFVRGSGVGTLLAQTAGPVAPFNAWFYLEASCTISDTVGVVKARVNGVEVLSFTGDTKNAGTASTIDAIVFSAPAGSGAGFRLDDLYVSDDTGVAPYNDFLGDVRVFTLSPTGAGNKTQLTPSTGANWSCVDEQPYSAADFVTGATAGLRDTYATADLPAGVTAVHGVQLGVIAKKSDAGAKAVKTVLRSGGTDYPDSVAQTANSSDAYHRSLRLLNPNGSVAWTPTTVNAMEIGVEVA